MGSETSTPIGAGASLAALRRSTLKRPEAFRLGAYPTSAVRQRECHAKDRHGTPGTLRRLCVCAVTSVRPLPHLAATTALSYQLS
jgi:hypothetical protein